MVRRYYVPQITELSEQELRRVFEAATPPVCLLGGWAVHLHVNPGFQSENGREYIGSRDIDIGIHVDSSWSTDELTDKPVAESINAIQSLGYTRSRFGFVQNFLRDNQERISEEEASRHGMHEVFQVYVDVIPDTREVDTFGEVFGFQPPAEPLLAPIFEQNKGEPLTEHVSWTASTGKLIAPPELLAAMKIRSFPDREKNHKQVKDLADLHALLWYVKDYNKIKSDTLDYISEPDIDRLDEALEEPVFEDAAQLLQINHQLIENSINRLLR